MGWYTPEPLSNTRYCKPLSNVTTSGLAAFVFKYSRSAAVVVVAVTDGSVNDDSVRSSGTTTRSSDDLVRVCMARDKRGVEGR